MNGPDDDALQALNYAMELEHQREQEMLAADPNYAKWLDSLNPTKGDDHGTHCESEG